MTMQSLSDVVVFDLDDTLYKEADFVESGFRAVASYLGDHSYAEDLISSRAGGKNAFEELISKYTLPNSIEELLEIYRNHYPSIQLDASTIEVLNTLSSQGKILGIISDGRSKTQRNKIDALGLYRWIEPENIIISEEFGSSKPDERNFRVFMSSYSGKSYVYIGDNTKKDFLAPNYLGWLTVCIKDNGRNIHPQRFDLSKEHLPDVIVDDIREII